MLKPTIRRPLVLGSIMVAMFMIAIEATIVSTVMPRIVGDLGGLQLYSWVFSAFLLAQTATTVVFGKLADLVGRTRVILFGIAIFLIGSILCGLAWSMPALIAFRLLQGIGAGAIQPVGMTIVGDLYAAEERGRIQGYLASVWAISAVIGPLAGGLIVENLSWAWIFWVNVPFGLLAALGFTLYLKEDLGHERRPVDYLGATLFTVAIASLMVGLTAISTSGGAEVLVLCAVFVVAAVLFVLQERRAPEPMISLRLWGRRPIAAANGASLLAGMALIGLTTFLPMYVQGIMGESALTAGFALSAMVLGWPIGATLAARTLTRLGVRRVLVAGSMLLPVGATAFLALDPAGSAYLAGAGSFVMGFGMGLLSSASLVLIQEIVEWSQRGSATASNLFARNLGSTLGATVFGAVLNFGLARSGHATAASSQELRQLLDGSRSTAVLESGVRAVLDHSLHLTFLAIFVLSVLTVALAAIVPHVTFAPRPPRSG
jgi:EmrB/QacA subfamily drug resistance transporter